MIFSKSLESESQSSLSSRSNPKSFQDFIDRSRTGPAFKEAKEDRDGYNMEAMEKLRMMCHGDPVLQKLLRMVSPEDEDGQDF